MQCEQAVRNGKNNNWGGKFCSVFGVVLFGAGCFFVFLGGGGIVHPLLFLKR